MPEAEASFPFTSFAVSTTDAHTHTNTLPTRHIHPCIAVDEPVKQFLTYHSRINTKKKKKKTKKQKTKKQKTKKQKKNTHTGTSAFRFWDGSVLGYFFNRYFPCVISAIEYIWFLIIIRFCVTILSILNHGWSFSPYFFV
jgi:hypothetical protein